MEDSAKRNGFYDPDRQAHLSVENLFVVATEIGGQSERCVQQQENTGNILEQKLHPQQMGVTSENRYDEEYLGGGKD